MSTEAMKARGIVLIDLLVYMAVVGVVLVLTGAVLNKAFVNGGELRRNMADIERAMAAGERWRADVRSATGPIRLEKAAGGERLEIPQANGVLVYELLSKAVRRQAAGATNAELALEGVRSARMNLEERAHASGWRWELELETRNKKARIQPLFTFTAVPGS
jgi:Tfp pilus assembly protein PilE